MELPGFSGGQNAGWGYLGPLTQVALSPHRVICGYFTKEVAGECQMGGSDTCCYGGFVGYEDSCAFLYAMSNNLWT